MASIHPKTYESIQKERLDTLFNDVLTSYAITNESGYQIKSTRVLVENLLEQIKELNKQYEHSMIRYGRDYSNELSQINNQYQESLKRQESLYAESLKSIKKVYKEETLESNKAIKELQQNYQSALKQTNTDIYRALVEMRQRHQELDLEYDKLKKNYHKSIGDIEDQKQSKLAEIKLSFEAKISENKSLEQVRQFKLSQEQKKLQKERQVEQNNFDESTIKIKTIFNRVTVKFNQKIREIQKSFQQIMGAYEHETNLSIDAINQEIETLKSLYVTNEREIIDRFEQDFIAYDEKLEQLKKEYEQNKDAITKKFSRDITINNSKLANYKDLNQIQQKALESRTNGLRKNVDTSSMDHQALLSEINRHYYQEKRHMEKELRDHIMQTYAQNLRRKKQHQKDLLDNECDFIQKQAKLKLAIKNRTQLKERDIQNNKSTFNKTYQSKISQIRLLERKLFLQNQIFKEKQVLKIYPYEAEVLLAREIHDTEVNYRTLENNHFKQNQSLIEKKTLLLSTIDELTLRKDRDVQILSNQYDERQANVVSYLNMEYEKNRLSGDRKVIDERKKEQELYYSKQESRLLNALEIVKERQNIEQKMIDFRQKFNQQILEVNENKSLIDHDSTVELAKINHTRETGIRKAKRIIDTSLNEIQRQRKLFDIYFQMLMAIIQEHDYFLTLFRDIYTTSSNEEFTEALGYLTEVFNAQLEYKDSIIESLEKDITAYYQEKIDELTEFKYMSLKQSINEELDLEVEMYRNEISHLEQQLKALRNTVTDLYQQVAVIQNNIDSIHHTKSIIHKQIESLGMHPLSKQNRKTALNLKKELKSLGKEILKNRADISHIRFQIKQHNREMHKINQSFKPLNSSIAHVEIKRTVRENNLKHSQYKEGKIYYDAIKEIAELSNSVKRSFNKHYDFVFRVFDRTTKTKLTDAIFKKQFHYIQNSFLKTKQALSSHHKEGILLCDRQHEGIQKDQKRIIHEYETSYRLTSLNIRITTEKRQSKLHYKMLELNKYKKSFMKIQTKHMDSQMKLLSAHHRDKLKQIDEKIAACKKDIERAFESKNSLLHATDLNIMSVLTEQGLTYKKELSLLESTYNTQVKEITDKIDIINNDLHQSDSVFSNKIQFYSTKEKQGRKRIMDSLAENRLKSYRSIKQNSMFIQDYETKTTNLLKSYERIEKRNIRRNTRKLKLLYKLSKLQSGYHVWIQRYKVKRHSLKNRLN